MLNGPWIHAASNRPCPVCRQERRKGRPVRCIFIPGQVALCYYAISEHARQTPAGPAWLHFLREREPTPRKSFQSFVVRPVEHRRRNDFHLLAQKFRSACSPARLDRLSRDLGISTQSLVQLDAGWTGGEEMLSTRGPISLNAWSFPLRNAGGNVVGISIRMLDGQKFSFTGSASGLHVPAGFISGGDAFLCEGPSDTGAACDLGLNALGRRSCASDVEEVLAFIRRQRLRRLIIFSQRDEVHRRRDGSEYWPAQDGAQTLARRALGEVPEVRIIMPPARQGHKDVRDWISTGATAQDVEQLVKEASPVRLQYSVHIRRKKGMEYVKQTTAR